MVIISTVSLAMQVNAIEDCTDQGGMVLGEKLLDQFCGAFWSELISGNQNNCINEL